MFKSKWVLFLAMMLVIFVGLTVVAFAMNPEGLFLVQGFDLMGHACTSICSI